MQELNRIVPDLFRYCDCFAGELKPGYINRLRQQRIAASEKHKTRRRIKG